MFINVPLLWILWDGAGDYGAIKFPHQLLAYKQPSLYFYVFQSQM